MAETRVERLNRLADEIANALEAGSFPETAFRTFRFLWKTTPDQEQDGVSLTLKDLEDMVATMRREVAQAAGAGKLMRQEITYYRIDDTSNS